MLTWIGHLKGVEGLPGIPARDLTVDEVEQFGGIEMLLATGLYAKAAGGKVDKKVAVVGEPGPELYIPQPDTKIGEWVLDKEAAADDD